MKDTGDFGNPLFEAITLLSVIKIVKKNPSSSNSSWPYWSSNQEAVTCMSIYIYTHHYLVSEQ